MTDSTDQGPPLAGADGAATGTEARVCQDIARRQQRGFLKYGFTVEENPLPLISWLRHAYEECLDQAVYLRRAIEEIEKSQDCQLRNAPHPPQTPQLILPRKNQST